MLFPLLRTRVKICGITQVEDAHAACAAGADAIGLVFYPRSSRFITIEQAARIVQRMPALVSTVALFLNADQADIEALLEQVPVSLLQFHGTESAVECERYGLPYIKAIGMVDNPNVATIMREHDAASGFLLDGHIHGAAGGTGQSFDWRQISEIDGRAMILAGGLNPSNIAQAIETVRPWGVDLSSGVEAEPGKKDHQKIIQLMSEVRRIDCCS